MGVLRSSLANLLGRRTTNVAVVSVLTLLMAGVLVLLILVRDVRPNLRDAFTSPAWSTTFELQGVPGAAESEVGAVRRLPGVRSVTAERGWSVGVGGIEFEARSYSTAFAIPFVGGSAPRPGHCDIAINRDSGLGKAVGSTVTIHHGSQQQAATIVAIIPRGYPLLTSNSLVTTCPINGAADFDPVYLVEASPAGLPSHYLAPSLASLADASFRSNGQTGMLGLLCLLLAVISLGVVASVARWAVGSRKSEFATLQVYGARKSTIAAVVALEQVILAALALPFAVLLGWCGALYLSRHSAGIVDPAAGWGVARPSPSTVLLVGGGFTTALVLLTLLSVVGILRRDVGRLLRRNDE